MDHTGAARNAGWAAENLFIVPPLTGVERHSAGAGTRFHHPFGRDGPLRRRDKEIDIVDPKSDLFQHAQGELNRLTQQR
jgi:hypothetical protein